MSTASKILTVFDYGKTLIDGVADYKVRDLVSTPIPDYISQRYYSESLDWIGYMQGVFDMLFEQGLSSTDIRHQVEKISMVDGMHELFQYLHKNQQIFEVVIISDSNSQFIGWTLQHYGIRSDAIYANPGEVSDDGRLIVKPFHYQDWCEHSTKNMCKGKKVIKIILLVFY